MKNFILTLLTVFGLMALASSCNTEKECPTNPMEGKNHVKFTGIISDTSMGRASNTTWSSGDAIGVYALNTGQAIPAGIYDGKENVKYTTPGDGEFTAASTPITFPETGALDFVAYYPYQTSITGYAYNIDVSTQTNSEAIDFLYSNNATNVAATAATTVNLTFQHKLSMIVLNVTAGDGITSLDGLTGSISDLKTDGSVSLANGNITLGSTSTTIAPVGTVSGTSGSLAAILVPGQNLNTASVAFFLNGQRFSWTPESQMLESGKKYIYTIQISTSGIAVLNPDSNIIDWDDEVIGTSPIVLTPDDASAITVDESPIAMPATGALTQNLSFTADAGQAWTITSSEPWLTVAPANGTGDGNITLTAEANTSTTARTATITITATGTDPLETHTITVTQAASAPQPVSSLLFAGADFEDWAAFTGGLNQYGLKNYAVQSPDGRNGSQALYMNVTPTGNDYVFTAKVPSNFSIAGKTKVVFYIKGTSGKSLSLNLYKANGTNYHVFNLADCTGDTTLTPANENTSGNGTNSYTGTINTGGNWVKVTLDLTSILSDISSTQGNNLFALKIGKEQPYDLLVDDITLE